MLPCFLVTPRAQSEAFLSLARSSLMALFLAITNTFAQNPGTLRWSFQASLPVQVSPALATNGTVYLVAINDEFQAKLYSVSSSGALNWSNSIGAITKSSPAIGTDGTIYVGNAGGLLFA